MPFLELQNLQKTYPDGTRAVRGIDLRVDKGEFIVLLGPSGCGKTTTLRMIAGLEDPTGGRITFDNQNVTHLPPSQRDVGFVFQFYALYPHMTVRKNIAFPLENIGTSPADTEAAIDRVAHALSIETLLNQYPRQLSGGDQQRVSLARAMVRTPDIYLMDEPLGTLDAEHRLELRAFIRRQQLSLSITAIYVTHDQEEALSLADRIVVMDGGKIRQIGSPSEIYNHPADLFVANFVGSPGMNLLTGQIVQRENGLSFTRPDTDIHIPIHANIAPAQIIFGMRPEFIRPTNRGIPGKVILSEYLGSHGYVHVDTPIGELIMRSTDRFAIGETIHLHLNETHIRLFDPDTETALA
ncbi:MAG: ABC transporter ATP-binding protein [Gemmatimonadetes bacterium]|nr:ABC transporter ATP-binding protein [Gemmatimonadota bacterium]MYC15360.1 ABC transporter ATP-binding protein [Gemmatimonadota bacterium]MYF73306.1 ABC transporter ATP-binding protein [Gemmatimonadota bacterium]MYK53352.1 ABC transporter ATP-binding protein [Gemmatimonadota bacterium]